MVYEKLNCISIHIPRTSGTSIRLSLKEYSTPKDSPFIGTRDTRFHLTAAELKEKHFNEEQWNNYFKFTIVRNPFDKMVSAYNMLCKEFKPSRFRDRLLFKDFIFRKGVFKEILKTPDSTTSMENKYSQIRPMHEFIYKNDNLLVDYVGKFEDIENEWEFICKKLKIENKLRHIRGYPINKHLRNRHYRDYYNDETKEFVLETYKKDLKTFGYKF